MEPGGYTASVIGHIRVAVTIAGGVYTTVGKTLERLDGWRASSVSANLLGSSGVLVTWNLNAPIPTERRRVGFGLHDPDATFPSIACFVGVALASEESDDTVVFLLPFQGVIPADGIYTTDLHFEMTLV